MASAANERRTEVEGVWARPRSRPISGSFTQQHLCSAHTGVPHPLALRLRVDLAVETSLELSQALSGVGLKMVARLINSAYVALTQGCGILQPMLERFPATVRCRSIPKISGGLESPAKAHSLRSSCGEAPGLAKQKPMTGDYCHIWTFGPVGTRGCWPAWISGPRAGFQFTLPSFHTRAPGWTPGFGCGHLAGRFSCKYSPNRFGRRGAVR